MSCSRKPSMNCGDYHRPGLLGKLYKPLALAALQPGRLGSLTTEPEGPSFISRTDTHRRTRTALVTHAPNRNWGLEQLGFVAKITRNELVAPDPRAEW